MTDPKLKACSKIAWLKSHLRLMETAPEDAAEELQALKKGVQTITEIAAEELRIAELRVADWKPRVEAWCIQATAALAAKDAKAIEGLMLSKPVLCPVGGFIAVSTESGTVELDLTEIRE